MSDSTNLEAVLLCEAVIQLHGFYNKYISKLIEKHLTVVCKSVTPICWIYFMQYIVYSRDE